MCVRNDSHEHDVRLFLCNEVYGAGSVTSIWRGKRVSKYGFLRIITLRSCHLTHLSENGAMVSVTGATENIFIQFEVSI